MTLLNKDQPAPYAGILFDHKSAQELKDNAEKFKTITIVLDSYEKSVNIYKRNQDLYDSKINTLYDQNDKLAKRLNEAKTVSTLETLGLFLLGAACATIVAYGAAKVTK